MKAWFGVAIAGAIVACGQQLAAQTTAAAADVLSTQDLRLERVAERLLVANDALCRSHMPVAGMLIHSRDQYRADQGAAFADGTVAIAQVLTDSPAAGLVEPGDGLVAIGQIRTDSLMRHGAAPLRDTVFEVLAKQPVDRPLSLTLRQAGTERVVAIPARAGCRALVEVRSVSGRNARSDGRVIQVDYGLAAATSDDELAVVFAHEFAHLVLEHRRRLDQAGVSKGFFGEFGKNQKLNREVEVEADRMSVHLLANAGYDPRIAPALWRGRLGRRIGGLSAVYPSPEARAQLLEREIADYLGPHGGLSWPGHLLARRDRTFQ